MTFHTSSLLTHLAALVPNDCAGLVVAFSGGLDSTVLLHALTEGECRWAVRAVHVNHNLHPDAQQWERHCHRQAASFDVAYEALSVQLEGMKEDGIEAAARRARYSALQASLRDQECLLTAHHADDQAETVLLALVRGTGVRGLAAMPALKSFGRGWHARPLLPFTRDGLLSYAREKSLSYLSDPANISERFARNHMRHAVLPALQMRWPDASRRIARVSDRMAEASELLDELADIDSEQCLKEHALFVDGIESLSRLRRNNVLRWWLRSRGARSPSAKHLEALWADVSTSATDRVPHMDVDEVRVFRHARFLYAEPIASFAAPSTPLSWTIESIVSTATGSLRARDTSGSGIAKRFVPSTLDIRYRHGGEELQLHAGGPHRTLKNLLQEAGVLPWWRDRVPLVYAGDRLLCVADLWVDASARAGPNEAGIVIEWVGRPERLQAIR